DYSMPIGSGNLLISRFPHSAMVHFGIMLLISSSCLLFPHSILPQTSIRGFHQGINHNSLFLCLSLLFQSSLQSSAQSAPNLHSSLPFSFQGILLFYRYSASSPCESQVPRFVYAIVYGLLTYLPEPLYGYSAFCSSITKSSEAAVILNIVVMFVLDVFNLLASFSLWRYNKCKMNNRSSYRLEETYRHRQNALTTFNLLPIELIHAVVYCSLFVVYVLGANLKRQHTDGEYLFINVITNIFPYYVLACPLILTILIHKDRMNRKNDVKGMIKQDKFQQYFQALAKQWNPEERGTMRKSV
ncbi:hypothetical protein PENTCL1PPCAC_2413, partial [Pristionchus entomophagus]